jgi:hypothetical protein
MHDYVTVLLFTISLASVYVVLQVLIVAEFLLFEKDNECAFRGVQNPPVLAFYC